MPSPLAARTTGVRPVPVLADVARAIRPVVLAHEQVVPVLPALSGLVSGQASGGALVRGRVVRVDGVAASSLALALVAGPSAAGCVDGGGRLCPTWAWPRRPRPGWPWSGWPWWPSRPPSSGPRWWPPSSARSTWWWSVPAHRVRAGDARRLAARARERGTILVHLAANGPRAGAGSGAAGAIEADLRLTGVEAHWQGLGHGHGHLQARRLVVEATGRRRAARPHRQELWLPDARGAVTAVTTPSAPSAPTELTRGPTPTGWWIAADRWRRVG